MSEYLQLIQNIRDVLACETGDSSAAAFAASFTELRGQAAARLTAFATILETGDEYSALKLSEEEPRLPDFIAQLTFPEEPQWLEYCAKQQFPVPAPLNETIVQALQKIYMRGISRNSPFYKDCLDALAQNDEERALQLLRTIIRLNPTDADAERELERLQMKKLAPLFAKLQTALAQNNKEAVLWWLDEMEKSATVAMLMNNSVYLAAASVRRADLQERACVEAEVLLDAADVQHQQKNWRAVAATLDRLHKLEKDHEWAGTPQQMERMRALQKYAREEHAAHKNLEGFNQALANLSAYADRINERIQSKAEFPALEAQKMERTFNEFWLRADQFQRPIPEAELVRLHAIAAALKPLTVHRDTTRRTPRVLAILPIVAIFVGTLLASHLYARATDYAKQLADLHERRLAGAARNLLVMLTSSGFNAVPSLRAQMEEIRKWTNFELQQVENTEMTLAEVQELVSANLEDMKPEEVMAKLKEASNSIQGLAPDLSQHPEEKFMELKGKVDIRFKALRAFNIDRARKQLLVMHALIKELDFSMPTRDMASKLSVLDKSAEQVEKCQHPEISALNLPGDIATTLRDLRAKSEEFTAEIAALTEIKRSMNAAEKLADYKSALERYPKLRFAETKDAIPALSSFPSEDEIAAAILFNGDMDAWQQACRQAAAPFQFRPNEMLEKEILQLTAMREDPNFNASASAKKILEPLRLNQILEPGGKRCKTPLLQVMDAVFRDPGGDPLVKACLAQNLYNIMKPRRTSWGLHYCPELAASMAELDAILGGATLRSSDCFPPKAQAKLVPKLTVFFDAATAKKPFFELATSYQNIVAQVVRLGVHYTGYLDNGEVVHLKFKGPSAAEVWAISEQEGGLVAIDLSSRTQNAADLKAVRKWSPLFMIAMPLSQTLAEHRADLKSAGQ